MFNFDRTLKAELADVADCLAQGHVDGAIAVWQGLMMTDFPKTDQQRLRDLGLMLLEQGDFEQRWLVSKELLKFGEGMIAPLLTLWQNPSATIEHRWFAGRLLGNFVRPEITVALTEIFSQPGDQDLWAIAAEGLSKQGELALTAISALLTHPDSRSLAVSILAQLSQPEALPLLKNLATDQDSTIRAQALQALGQYSPVQLMPIFLQAIADPVAKVRRQAVEGLGLYLKSLPPQADSAQAEEVVHQLHPLLLDLDPVVCQQTVIAISQSPITASVEILAKTLASPHTPEPLRLTVIKCLGWMETEESLAALATVFANPFHSQSPADLMSVIQALGRIKTQLHQLTAGKLLLTFAQSDHPCHQNPNLRKQLSQSWAQLHYLPALSLLQSWQYEADIGVKLHAQAALKILAASQ